MWNNCQILIKLNTSHNIFAHIAALVNMALIHNISKILPRKLNWKSHIQGVTDTVRTLQGTCKILGFYSSNLSWQTKKILIIIHLKMWNHSPESFKMHLETFSEKVPTPGNKHFGGDLASHGTYVPANIRSCKNMKYIGLIFVLRFAKKL